LAKVVNAKNENYAQKNQKLIFLVCFTPCKFFRKFYL